MKFYVLLCQDAADTAKHIAEITGVPLRVEQRLKEQNLASMNQLQDMEKNLKRQNKILFTILMVERQCYKWQQEYIVFWMN